MANELKTSYWKRIRNEEEFVEINNKLATRMPGYYGNSIVVLRIGDPMAGGTKGIIVSTWIKVNVDWCKKQLDDILGGLEDLEQ